MCTESVPGRGRITGPVEEGWIAVTWNGTDAEESNNYRVGADGLFDLAFASAMHTHHPHELQFTSRSTAWNCDVCLAHSAPLRWRCTAGCDWDACGRCVAAIGVDDHTPVRLNLPSCTHLTPVSLLDLIGSNRPLPLPVAAVLSAMNSWLYDERDSTRKDQAVW